MLRVGLTGGIGAGKSTVSQLLRGRGAFLIDADRLAREVVDPGTDGLAEVVAAFGADVLTESGALDRPALGRRVFADVAARARLEAILHPRIAALTAERMRSAGDEAVVVHDVPLLVENGMGAGYHLVIVVDAPVEERVRRLVGSRGMSEDDARARIAAQADDAARRAAADVLLDNSGDPADLDARVDALWDRRLVPFAENLRRRRPATGAAAVPDPAAHDRVLARVLRATGSAAVPVSPPTDPAAPVTDRAVTPTDPAAPVTGAGASPGNGGPAAGPGIELWVAVPDPDTAEALGEPLAAAGFVRVPTGSSDEYLHRGADPALAVTLHVRTGHPRVRP